MDRERPPETDAEYRLVHGAWPRWVIQLSLLKLALRTGAVVLVFFLIAIAITVAIFRRW